MKLPKTATFIEGEKMELECTVYGVPTPEVSWKFGKCLKNINYLCCLDYLSISITFRKSNSSSF